MAYNYPMSQPVGFQKLAFAPRLTGAALGAGLGAIAAPEGEGWTGAALGGLTGYGLGALGSRAAGLFRRSPRPPAAPQAITNPTRLLPAPASSARATGPAQVLGPDVDIRHAKKVGFEKLADLGMSFGIPGIGVNVAGKDERLPGMDRWVPRGTIERAYQGLEQGYDAPALYEQAAGEGRLLHPAIGAVGGAALAHKLPGILARLSEGGTALTKGVSPVSNAGFTALSGLLGASTGALYNRATEGDRVEGMHQAIRGVSREKAKQPSAREAMPMVMSSSGDDV